MRFQPFAWLGGVLGSVVLAPTIALTVVLPNSGEFSLRVQAFLHPAIAMLGRTVDFDLVALAGGPSASKQTQGTSTPLRLTGGGRTAGAPSVFGFNATLEAKPNGTHGHWNSQNPRCNGPVTAIFPQPDPSNGFNFQVNCNGSVLEVRANDNGEGRSAPADQLDLAGPAGEPTQPISNGNIQAHH